MNPLHSVSQLLVVLTIFLCTGCRKQSQTHDPEVLGPSAHPTSSRRPAGMRHRSQQSHKETVLREHKVLIEDLRSMARDDILASLGKFCDLWSSDEENLQLLFDLIYGDLVDQNKDLFFDRILKISDFKPKKCILNLAIRYLADHSPGEAGHMLKLLPPILVEPATIEDIADAFFQSSPSGIKDFLSDINKSSRSLAVDKLSSLILNDLNATKKLGEFPASYLIGDSQIDTELVAAVLRGGGGPTTLEQLMNWRTQAAKTEVVDKSGTIYCDFASRSPELALKLMKEQNSIDKVEKGALLSGLSLAMPQEACKIAIEGDLPATSYRELINRWLDFDSVAASSWLVTAPPTPSRTKMVQAMIVWLDAHGNTQEAENWKAYLRK